MSFRCGIDLGTTYSAISFFGQDDRVDTIDLETADGGKLLRSVVYYPGPGEPPVVGETAWNAARQYSDRVIIGIKRSMGSGYKTPAIDGVEHTAPEVSAEILKVLVADARKFLGEEVRDVVITVPAHFGDNERAATLEAGQLAGLNVLQLLPEPHAAALAYALERVSAIDDRHLLVYDLGGGTFDVTLIHARRAADAGNAIGLKIETLCKDGNALLGGLDWDKVLAEVVAEKVLAKHGADVRADPQNEPFLLDQCEKAKRHLSRVSSYSVAADLAGHQVDVTRDEFEDRTRDLVLSTRMLVERVLEDAERDHQVPKGQIDLLLTGGSSRMPMVRKMAEEVMGKPPLLYGNPDLMVTVGAAYWAHLLQAGATVPSPQGPVSVPGGIEETGKAVGVEVVRRDGDGRVTRANAVIIPENSPQQKDFTKDFRTAADNMTEIAVVLYEGESAELGDCKQLMRFTITGLPPGRPKGRPVRVSLRYDASGILRGKAVDVETGKEVPIVLDRSKPEAVTV